MPMSKFFLLLKAQLASALNQGRQNSFGSKSKKVASFGGMMFFYALMFALAAFYEYMFAGAFYSVAGNFETFTTVLVFGASALTLFSSVSSVKNVIFCSRDYDMTLSLPISAGTVVAAKTATVYIFDLITTALILLPLYFMPLVFHAQMPVSYWVMYPLLMLFVPMLPIMIGALISALVSFISAHFKYMRVVSMLIYVAFIGGIFYLSLSSSNIDKSEVAAALDAVTKSGLMRYYPFAGMFTAALTLDLKSIAIFFGAGIAAFALVCFIFGRFYGELHDFFNKKQTGGRYKLSAGAGNARSALFKKEISRIFSSGMILMNSCSGVLMLVIAAVLAMVKISSLDAASFEAVAPVLGAMAPFFIGMMAGMSCTTYSSISLEGRCLPLLKSLPISYGDIIKTKLRVHFTLLFAPIAIASALIAAAIKADIVTFIFTLLIPLAFSYYSGVFGMLLNLKKYNLDWTNEIAAVKQGFAVMVTIFTTMITSMIGMFASIVLVAGLSVPPLIIFSAFFTLQLIACGIVTYLLKAKGEKLFTAVGE